MGGDEEEAEGTGQALRIWLATEAVCGWRCDKCWGCKVWSKGPSLSHREKLHDARVAAAHAAAESRRNLEIHDIG